MGASINEWFEAAFPFDLGDDNHRWSWLVRAAPSRDELPQSVANYVPTVRDILWRHRCSASKRIEGWATCWIDVSTGTRHRLTNDDPEHLSIEPSILCPIGCGDHGFVRDGKWVAA